MRSDHYKTRSFYYPSHGDYLIKFWRSSVGNCYFGKFSFKIWNVFFKHYFWPYLRNGLSNWREMQRKCITWRLGMICDLDLWSLSWSWPWMFQSQISKSLYLGNCWSDWCEMKRKQINRILGWLLFDHTHDLGVSRSEPEIALSQEWDSQLTWNEKD